MKLCVSCVFFSLTFIYLHNTHTFSIFFHRQYLLPHTHIHKRAHTLLCLGGPTCSTRSAMQHRSAAIEHCRGFHAAAARLNPLCICNFQVSQADCAGRPGWKAGSSPNIMLLAGVIEICVPAIRGQFMSGSGQTKTDKLQRELTYL